MAPKKGKPIDAGIIARVVSGVRYMINGNAPQEWMGSGQPLQPLAQEIEYRGHDYPFSVNTNIKPRANYATSFEDLRGIGDGCTLVRLAVETRKDQMSWLKWQIQPIDSKLPPDSRCDELMAAFRFPDGINDWATWLRMLLEDLLVIDAPTIYIRKNYGGKPIGFLPIDGATIKVVIDNKGYTPPAPAVAYQQYLKGMPAVDYSADEIEYSPRNKRTNKIYGFSPVEQVLLIANTALRKELFQLNYYTDGNIPDAIMGVPATWTPDQIKQFQNYWDEMIEGQLAERRKMRFVADGTKYTPLKIEPLKNEFDEWLARVICYAFSLPPTAFTNQVNRATAETAQETAADEGIAGLVGWVTNLMNKLLLKYYGISDLEFKFISEEESDPLVEAQIDAIYLDRKVITPNEVRAKLGKDPLTPAQIAELTPPAPDGNGDTGSQGAPGQDTGQNNSQNSSQKLEKRKKKVQFYP